jgi:hypothetical protein
MGKIINNRKVIKIKKVKKDVNNRKRIKQK